MGSKADYISVLIAVGIDTIFTMTGMQPFVLYDIKEKVGSKPYIHI